MILNPVDTSGFVGSDKDFDYRASRVLANDIDGGLRLSYKAHPKQAKFLDDTHKYVLLCGGVGSGKTHILCLNILKYVLDYAGIRILVVTMTERHLRDTVLTVFRELLPSGLGLVDRSSMKPHVNFTFMNGSTVLMRSFEKDIKAVGYTTGAVFIDEAIAIDFDVFNELRLRVRQPGNYPRSIRCCTNAGLKSDWVYKFFYQSQDDSNRSLLEVSPLDNIFLPKDTLEDIFRMREDDPDKYRRMVLNEWGVVKGRIYDLTVKNFLKTRDMPSMEAFDYVAGGLDFGGSDPTAIVILGFTGRGVYMLEEFQSSHEVKDDLGTLGDLMHGYVRKYGDRFSIFMADSENTLAITTLCNMGLPVEPAKKYGAYGVSNGIKLCQKYINSGQFKVDSERCEKFILQAEGYRWNTKVQSSRHIPIRSNCHLLDAFRYCLVTFCEELEYNLYMTA